MRAPSVLQVAITGYRYRHSEERHRPNRRGVHHGGACHRDDAGRRDPQERLNRQSQEHRPRG